MLILSLVLIILSSILAAGMSKEQLLEVQKELKEESYYLGQIDGLYGPQTAKAIKNYQKANDLKTDSRNIEDNYLLILNNNKKEINYSVSLGNPGFAIIKYNEDNKIKSMHGINWSLGYSYRRYGEGLDEGFNGYGEIGTHFLLIPYGAVGTDYVFSMEEDGSHWSINVGAQVLTDFERGYILPQFGISRRF